MTDSLRFSQVVASRLCHDLSGAIAAVASALELAVEEAATAAGDGAPASAPPAPAHPVSAAEAIAAAADGAHALGARVRLLRAIFAGELPTLTAPELDLLVDGLPVGRRIVVDAATLAADPPLDPPLGRVVLCALLLACEALPGGGRITVLRGPAEIAVALAGRDAPGARPPAWPSGFVDLLAQPDADTVDMPASGRALLAPWTVLVAAAGGIRLSFLHGETAAAPTLLISG